ncbi:unknown [Haloarcula marismortui ATCC 43049]|uniref:Uncharacterized protein n=1 Tax=Haloarcula marismortui (strain ATCC 43049 / DSM 3752 / JCM 8966 / VKM B-1809) TaxID=272569 RepID=Q5V002_HALMA|nr:unknown [Haloarcula marismortui ATCC 43049]
MRCDVVGDSLVPKVDATDRTFDESNLVVAEPLNHPAHPQTGDCSGGVRYFAGSTLAHRV